MNTTNIFCSCPVLQVFVTLLKSYPTNSITDFVPEILDNLFVNEPQLATQFQRLLHTFFLI